MPLPPLDRVGAGQDHADGPRPCRADVRPRALAPVYADADAFPRRRRRDPAGDGGRTGCRGLRLRADRRAELHRLRRPAHPRADAGRAATTRCRASSARSPPTTRSSQAPQGKAVFGLHVCRGNRASMWHREGKYDAIAEAVFGGLKYDRLLLEYDTDRAGSFAPLRYVPKGVIAVLGLITTKTGRVETVDELRTPDRRRGPSPAARAARDQPAVRFRVGDRRQPAEPRRSNGVSSTSCSRPRDECGDAHDRTEADPRPARHAADARRAGSPKPRSACCRTTSIPKSPSGPKSSSSTAASAAPRATGTASTASSRRCARLEDDETLLDPVRVSRSACSGRTRMRRGC